MIFIQGHSWFFVMTVIGQSHAVSYLCSMINMPRSCINMQCFHLLGVASNAFEPFFSLNSTV